MRRDFQHDFSARLQRAERAISSLTHKAERALQAKSQRMARRETDRLEGLGKVGSGVRDTMDLVSDSRRVRDTKHQALGDNGRYREHPQSARGRGGRRTSNKDLDSSMDSWFSRSSNQDRHDEQALHGSPKAETRDIQDFFAHQGLSKRTHDRDLEDERRLSSPNRLNPQDTLKRREQIQSMQERALYNGAIQNALNPGGKKRA
ncbi:hypothetical protein T484DRAFT_2930086 [Baffinella frigidus]|nr:hypothetical protein T484DRAFT_2930086 [Cryptophyta sp. CCMP2293]